MTAPGAGASGEDSLIARYFRPLATDPGAFGLGDDAAILKALGEDIVVTTDAIVEGVHFLPDDPPGHRRAKSAAGEPFRPRGEGRCAGGLCADAGVARGRRRVAYEPFARGLGADAAAFGCPLLGGDTVSTPGPLMISITAFGRVAPGQMVHRSGARPGDRVVVTGTIGDAALGLDILRGGRVAAALAGDAAAREMLVGRYRVPQPRNALAHGGPRSCPCGDGCLRRPCRRSRQALRGVRRVGRHRRARHPLVGRGRGGACGGRRRHGGAGFRRRRL